MTEAVQPAVLVDRPGNVMVITINRPEARNAVNSAVSGVGATLVAAGATSDVALAANVDAGTGTLTLNAGRSISQSAGTVSAATLTGTGWSV